MNRFLVTMMVIFVVLAAGFFAMRTAAPEFHFIGLEAANLLMAVLSVVTFLIVRKQLNGRPQAFVRGVSGASFVKLMVCMIAMLVYILLNRKHMHKPSVFVMFGIYAVYTIAETVLLSKLARE